MTEQAWVFRLPPEYTQVMAIVTFAVLPERLAAERSGLNSVVAGFEANTKKSFARMGIAEGAFNEFDLGIKYDTDLGTFTVPIVIASVWFRDSFINNPQRTKSVTPASGWESYIDYPPTSKISWLDLELMTQTLQHILRYLSGEIDQL